MGGTFGIAMIGEVAAEMRLALTANEYPPFVVFFAPTDAGTTACSIVSIRSMAVEAILGDGCSPQVRLTIIEFVAVDVVDDHALRRAAHDQRMEGQERTARKAVGCVAGLAMSEPSELAGVVGVGSINHAVLAASVGVKRNDGPLTLDGDGVVVLTHPTLSPKPDDWDSSSTLLVE